MIWFNVIISIFPENHAKTNTKIEKSGLRSYVWKLFRFLSVLNWNCKIVSWKVVKSQRSKFNLVTRFWISQKNPRILVWNFSLWKRSSLAFSKSFCWFVNKDMNSRIFWGKKKTRNFLWTKLSNHRKISWNCQDLLFTCYNQSHFTENFWGKPEFRQFFVIMNHVYNKNVTWRDYDSFCLKLSVEIMTTELLQVPLKKGSDVDFGPLANWIKSTFGSADAPADTSDVAELQKLRVSAVKCADRGEAAITACSK